MSSKKMLVMKCDRCGREESADVVFNDPLVNEEYKFRQEHDGWGVVKYQNTFFDLCPSCNEKYKEFFGNLFTGKEEDEGGPLDEKL